MIGDGTGADERGLPSKFPTGWLDDDLFEGGKRWHRRQMTYGII
jgi:hypothetical protein